MPKYLRPFIMCVLMSPRGYARFHEVAFAPENAGKLIIAAAAMLACDGVEEDAVLAPDIRRSLTEIECTSIDISDEVFVLNEEGHISPNVAWYIEYAHAKHKLVRYYTPTP